MGDKLIMKKFKLHSMRLIVLTVPERVNLASGHQINDYLDYSIFGSCPSIHWDVFMIANKL